MSTWAVDHRPLRFAEVAGQDRVALVLRRRVASYHSKGKPFPQAMIMAGPRGTGKTSTARILARALNCQATTDGEPCGVCSSCFAISSRRSAGVAEMDMASHGSVDGIRDLKAASAFALVEDWRVYLMDEVHSASAAAFDALLTILEEPPPKTLFLLVTTEPDQIPETITSRCQHYEFRRIPVPVIEARLRELAGLHGVTDRIEDGVYRVLAVLSRGGMRDAVMKLEQLCEDDVPVTLDLVKETYGVSDLPERLLDAALKGDLARGLSVLREALDSASPPVPLLEALLDGLTALLAASTGLPPDPGAVVSPEWILTYAATDYRQISAAMKTLSDARNRIQPGGASAPSTLAVAYSLAVRDLAPSAFAPVPAGLAPRPSVSAPPGGGVSAPSAPEQNGTQALRHLSPDALKAILGSDAPLTPDEVRRLAG